MTASTIYCNECGAANTPQASQCFACDNALYSSPSLPGTQSSVAALPNSRVVARGVGPLAPSYLLHSRYSIVRQVGSGGFGAVYVARDTLFGNRRVAIKEMSQDGLQPQELAEAMAAFEHEALMLADLIHPNLPRIHDHFTEHACSYVVMDFIAGDTLEDYLDKVVRQLPVEDVLSIGIQLCTVLEYLHAQQPPIIFRDLKPANIMRTPDNSIYIIDFGIARHFQPGKAKDTIPLGSRGYAAPEQYGKAQTTPQTDIFGLGATLHELLTGEDPSLTPFHFSYVYIAGSPISAQVNALLKRMLEMEMSKRPASIAEVRQELQHLVVQLTAKRPSLMQKAARNKLQRRSFLIGLVSVIATCSGSSVITALVYTKRNDAAGLNMAFHSLAGNTPESVPTTRVPAAANYETRSVALFTYQVNAGAVTAVAWMPRGEYIASVGSLDSAVQVWDARTGNSLLISTLDVDTAEHTLPPHKIIVNTSGLFQTNNRRVDMLAWSSDGKRLAAALDDNSVLVWSIQTGDELVYRLSQHGTANALTWLPDGTSIASVSGNTGVQVWDATTGDLQQTYAYPLQAILALAWSPDGRYLATGSVDGTIRVWDVKTGITVVIYREHMGTVNAVSWSPDSRYIASGGADSLVRVWDAVSGETLFTYRGHSDSVRVVAWQGEAKLFAAMHIASGGADMTVQVWPLDMSSKVNGHTAVSLRGKVVLYRGHFAQVLALAWSSDGERIVSSSEDGTVQVWRAI